MITLTPLASFNGGVTLPDNEAANGHPNPGVIPTRISFDVPAFAGMTGGQPPRVNHGAGWYKPRAVCSD
jgi:hypothetical protein